MHPYYTIELEGTFSYIDNLDEKIHWIKQVATGLIKLEPQPIKWKNLPGMRRPIRELKKSQTKRSQKLYLNLECFWCGSKFIRYDKKIKLGNSFCKADCLRSYNKTVYETRNKIK